ncbi:maleylpyruvate isomerase family mycothiol-dependent enzyme [Pseudonocardia pini]|uniref:maleylpyruvate isomerase family mycothiol-dependent enzyme n=1 Tax=Pseudonocardia pini TaxID=2758030 RepID=UPI0015EFE795|nr:maleylpyruvate isomerase family mycothiol-dependent enzyme [Pseudonocardia pini]
MDFTRHCTEIVGQTAQLVREVSGTDLRAPVPGCPGWTLGMLLRHIGAGHRWAEEIVRTRAQDFLDDTDLRVLEGDDSGPVPDLVPGAEALAATLRAAGPDAEVWVPFHYRHTAFYARRFAFETLVHRVDATQAAGLPVTAAPEVVAAALDEWMELDALPAHFALEPAKREVLGVGRTLALEATDTGDAWSVDLTGEEIRWRRGTGPAAVTVRGPLTELLLLVYRRRSADGPAVSGDRALLQLWSSHVAFA